MIKLFGASWCNPCRMAKKWLNDHAVAFEYIDVEGGSPEVDKYRIMTVPTLIMGDKIITGFSAQEYTEELSGL